jgi:hypothetical protein
MTARPLPRSSHVRHSMKFFAVLGSLSFVLLILLAFPAVSAAPTVAQCTPSGSDCAIPENIPLQFPFLLISGDVPLAPNLHSNLNAVSDVFHLDNNFFDTGAGTGIGFAGILFSGEQAVPPISSYSANAVEIRENPAGHGDTQYFGNGTDYHLETGVLSNRGGNRASARAKNAIIDLADGPIAVHAGSGTQIGQGLEQDPGQPDGLAFYSTNYTSLGGKQIPFNIVGSNPANGAATTTIATFIVPIKVVFATPAAKLLPGTLNGFLDGTEPVSATQNSPIFLDADYTVGGTDLGITQYGDALQRGEFHNIPGFSQDYHVLLGTPTVMPTQTVTVTDPTQGNLYKLKSGTLLGVVASGVLESQVIIPTVRDPHTLSSTLPIFLTDNVFESSDGTINTCCVLGYHNSQVPPATTAKTLIYAAHTEKGTFRGDVILDVQALSHEVAEWLNDPFVGALKVGFVNLIPPAVLPGTGGACIINFETGDPLEAPPAVFTQTTSGTTYHLQDEVFLPWYLHSSPSFSVNGQFSFQNTFTTPSSLCGPG